MSEDSDGGFEMVPGDSPTIRRRQLGAELKALRLGKSLTGEEVASRVEWDRTKVYRIEGGKQGIRPKELRELLDLYGVTDPEQREEYLAAAREGKRRGWWSVYGPLPKVYETYIGIETEASEIGIWEPLVVHGLVQTEDYARSVIRGGGAADLPDDEVERQVQLRLARQGRLSDVPKWLILGEAALHLEIGGPDILRGQLAKLLERSHDPKMTMQVVPFSEGAHGGLRAAFTVLTLPDGQVIYSETLAGDIYPEGDEARACNVVFDQLRARALSPDRTRALIKTKLEGAGL